ncbi:pilus assembly protein [Salinibius halmophilus]|uniref:pilus assembly protein n=1 Tax=Salinibius halmophilus TaxID=1853216 RepID=UPI001314C368|nr:PilC/PilY family type IV pilus protein [Salinibius halmophilus]
MKPIITIAIPLALVSTPALADMAQEPLFLGSAVKPNIFFLVDDSGSMDWEILKSDGALAVPSYSGYANSGSFDRTPTPSDTREALESCAGYNVLYYDPTKTYEPWAGVDKNGQPYANQVITGARNNPYDPDEGVTNLTQHDGSQGVPGYFVWTDDGDGVFERGECPEPGRAGYDHKADFVTTTSVYGSSNIMSAMEMQNFANWFTYYRKREYVAKAALLKIIAESDARLGLATLHRNSSVGYPVQDMTIDNHRAELMAQVASISSNGGTPLRTRLNWVGQYFEDRRPSNLFGRSVGTPILSEDLGGTCQQNFSVVMSDGYWNGSSPGIGNADSGTSGDNYKTRFDGGSYADLYSNTLADVAMHYYERDLAPNLANNVPVNPADDNSAQHLVTYTVAFGVNGTLDISPQDPSASFNWPQPVANEQSTIDDLRHAAWNGRGEFLNASDPSALSDAFSRTIASIEGRVSSSASVAANTTQLSTNSRLFQARFDSSNWSGQLLAYPVNQFTGKPEDAIWDAAERMPQWDERTVVTSHNNNGIRFSWSQLTDAQRLSLNVNPVSGNYDGQGESRLRYLLGDATFEGSRYPTRKPNGAQGNLGDIVHSNPFYIAPSAQFGYQQLTGEGASYASYVANKRAGSEPAMIYVGANDGMLHAFNASGTEENCTLGTGGCAGEELFAFIPKAVFGQLNALTQINGRHRYFVDGSPVVSDAYVSGSWRTALVGTLGAGGKGLFALDVSEPSKFGTSDVFWDLSAADFSQDTSGRSDLGYILGEATIVRLANGKFAAITGNGVNSDSGRALLYIIPLDDPSKMITIDTGVGSTTAPNGLSSPLAIDTNGDRIADTVYAGDLRGHMWEFDLSASSTDEWVVANGGNALFRACRNNNCNSPQPITSKPQAVRHNGGIMVVFGTGKYYENNDSQVDANDYHSFYAIYDDGNAVAGRNNLLEQRIIAELASSEGRNARVTTSSTLDLAVHDGWYIDFRQPSSPGERIVVEPVVRFNRVIFPTLVPNNNPCAFGGTSWLMELDIRSGSRLPESVLDTNQDGVVNDDDRVVINEGQDDEAPVVASGVQSQNNIIGRPAIIADDTQEYKQFSGSTGNIETIAEDSEAKFGRQSWIQLR